MDYSPSVVPPNARQSWCREKSSNGLSPKTTLSIPCKAFLVIRCTARHLFLFENLLSCTFARDLFEDSLQRRWNGKKPGIRPDLNSQHPDHETCARPLCSNHCPEAPKSNINFGICRNFSLGLIIMTSLFWCRKQSYRSQQNIVFKISHGGVFLAKPGSIFQLRGGGVLIDWHSRNSENNDLVGTAFSATILFGNFVHFSEATV